MGPRTVPPLAFLSFAICEQLRTIVNCDQLHTIACDCARLLTIANDCILRLGFELKRDFAKMLEPEAVRLVRSTRPLPGKRSADAIFANFADSARQYTQGVFTICNWQMFANGTIVHK